MMCRKNLHLSFMSAAEHAGPDFNDAAFDPRAPIDPSRALTPHVLRLNERRVERGFWPKIRKVAAHVPFAADALSIWYCARDDETPAAAKGMMLAALAYFVLPADAVPVVPVRNVSLFPGVVMPITVGRELSIAAAQEAVRGGNKLALLAQRDPSMDKPGAADLYEIGVLATVIRYVTTPEGAHHLVCQGESRFRVLEMVRGAMDAGAAGIAMGRKIPRSPCMI